MDGGRSTARMLILSKSINGLKPMRWCVYLSVCVRMYTHTWVCVRECACACMLVYVCASACVCVWLQTDLSLRLLTGSELVWLEVGSSQASLLAGFMSFSLCKKPQHLHACWKCFRQSWQRNDSTCGKPKPKTRYRTDAQQIFVDWIRIISKETNHWLMISKKAMSTRPLQTNYNSD